MACNSEKCHCPACNEERRLKGLEHRVDVLELRERNRDMMSVIDRESARRDRLREARTDFLGVDPPVNKRSIKIGWNPRGPVYRGWGFDDDVIWQWVQSKHNARFWRRLNLKTRITFGCPWSNRGRPITPWGGPLPKITAVEHTEHKRVGEIAQTVTDRIEFEGGQPEIRFDVRDYAAGPEQFKIVHNPAPRSWVRDEFEADAKDVLRQARRAALSGDTHIGDFITPKCRITYPYLHREGAKEFMRSLRAANPKETAMSPDVIRAVMRLYENANTAPHPTVRAMYDDAVNLGLADTSSGRTYRITPKGRVFAEAILALPLPVATEPEWQMPPRS